MKCVLCLFDTKEPVIVDEKVYCIQCNDINNFANDIKKDRIIKTKVLQPKTTNENYIKCPKCKNKFSTKKCICGYKNPFI
jgi:hypothetical protein